MNIIIDNIGTKKWYSDGVLHRINGPTIEHIDGTKIWYNHGEYYKIESFTCTEWFYNHHHHRIDGPVIIYGTNEQFKNKFYIYMDWDIQKKNIIKQ